MCGAMVREFPEIVTYKEIGKSYEGKPIRGYIFMNRKKVTEKNNSFEEEAKKRPGIFINGAHHPRELTSISMCVYIMLKLLHTWSNRTDADYLLAELIDTRSVVYVVPIVNIDGVRYMS